MAEQNEAEIILYDLGSVNNVPFSPMAWRIRLMLNYKQIPYRTVFLEFPDIEPTLKGLGIQPHESEYVDYTVPVIHHVPTGTYIMDSLAISQFIESKYPDPEIPLTSELGLQIQTATQAATRSLFRIAVKAHVVNIISPRAQVYFRQSRQALLGHPLEELDDPVKEDQAWASAHDGLTAASDLILTRKADGPFVLGAKLSYTDFWITGLLEWAKVANIRAFERITQYPGFKRVYEACVPYMDKKD